MKVVIEIPDGIDPPKADYIKSFYEETKEVYDLGYRRGKEDMLKKISRMLSKEHEEQQ